jgi:hypothetical protein
VVRILIPIKRLSGVQIAEEKSNEETGPNLRLGFDGLGESLTVCVVQKHAEMLFEDEQGGWALP